MAAQRHRRLAAFILGAAIGAFRAGAADWGAVYPALLAEKTPRIDPDAPAEAVFWKITIDDRNFPTRTIEQYIRYKIFVPEKATSITRISEPTISYNHSPNLPLTADIQARLISPDGTIHEFGQESLRERPVLGSAAQPTFFGLLFAGSGNEVDVNEKFLAISGVEPGSILDVHLTHTSRFSALNVMLTLQRKLIPTRELEIVHFTWPNEANFPLRPFLLNGSAFHAALSGGLEAHTLVITAQNITALEDEPFSGPLADHALTYIVAYTPANTYMVRRHFTDNFVAHVESGPWAPLATEAYILETDGAWPTHRVKELAANLTAGAGSPLEQARRIHNFVQTLHNRFAVLPRKTGPGYDPDESLDEVIDFESHPKLMILDRDFVWLEIALYRSAGFNARAVLLPNKDFGRFDIRLVDDGFLPFLCTQILIDGRWLCSVPLSPSVPFGLVPWESDGAVGLVAQPDKQEFVPIPSTPAEQSVIANSGEFHLSPDGSLEGECRRTYTGQAALTVRRALAGADDGQRRSKVQRLLEQAFKPAEITIRDLTGVNDADQLLAVSFRLRYPDFAVVTKDRIIFRPSVFHAFSPPPFTRARRRYPVEMPYQWKETDQVLLHVPAGYSLESKWTPVSGPGRMLSYQCAFAFDPKTRDLHLQREYTSRILFLAAGPYPRLKGWMDGVAANDQHELVLRRTGPAPAGPENDADSDP